MQKISILFIIVFFSCNSLEDSRGDYNEIIILASSEDKKYLYSKINNIFNSFIYTPKIEYQYSVNWVDPLDFEHYLNYRNLLFVSLNEPSDSTIDKLNSRFVNQYNKNIFALNNVYSKKQSIIFFVSKDTIELNYNISQYEDWIKKEFDINIENHLYTNMYRHGRNSDIEKLILDYYNMEIQLQNSYMIVENDSIEQNFTWIGRVYPYRWIAFFKLNNIDKIKLWEEFEIIVENNMENVSISKYYKNMLFESDDIIKLQGLFEEENSLSGGPFIAYAKLNEFDQVESIVAGFTSNPGKKKNSLIKELEIQISNIKYKE